VDGLYVRQLKLGGNGQHDAGFYAKIVPPKIDRGDPRSRLHDELFSAKTVFPKIDRHQACRMR
jgi:hypothetical protein